MEARRLHHMCSLSVIGGLRRNLALLPPAPSYPVGLFPFGSLYSAPSRPSLPPAHHPLLTFLPMVVLTMPVGGDFELTLDVGFFNAADLATWPKATPYVDIWVSSLITLLLTTTTRALPYARITALSLSWTNQKRHAPDILHFAAELPQQCRPVE